MEIPKADINGQGENNPVIMPAIATEAAYTSERKYTVAIPDNDFNDSLVEVRASVLMEIRQKLTDAQSIGFNWLLDLLLAFGGVCWGGWISYLQSNGTYTDGQKFIFGTLLFGLALATTVAFGIFRAFTSSGRNVNMVDILKLVPDPHKAIKKEQP